MRSREVALLSGTAHKMKFFIKDFFSKPIPKKLRIWSHLLKKSLMENFIFCAVTTVHIERIQLINLMSLFLTLKISRTAGVLSSKTSH